MEAALKEKGGASKNLGPTDIGVDLLGTKTDMKTVTTTAKNREFCSANAKKASPIKLSKYTLETIYGRVIATESNKRAMANYEYNKKLKNPGGFINGQRQLSNWKMRNVTVGGMGCGIVASYNALIALGKTDYSLADVILYFDLFSFLNFEKDGMLPFVIEGFFRKIKVPTSSTGIYVPEFEKNIEALDKNVKRSNVTILEYFYTRNHNPLGGGHYIAIQPIANGVREYNRKSDDYDAHDFADMKTWLAKTNHTIIGSVLFL